MKARELLPWVPSLSDNHLHASLENDVTSFLVDTSIYRKKHKADKDVNESNK